MTDLYYLDFDDNCVCIRYCRTGECVDSFRFYDIPGKPAGDAIARAQHVLDSLNAQWQQLPAGGLATARP